MRGKRGFQTAKAIQRYIKVFWPTEDDGKLPHQDTRRRIIYICNRRRKTCVQVLNIMSPVWICLTIVTMETNSQTNMYVKTGFEHDVSSKDMVDNGYHGNELTDLCQKCLFLIK
ncbi:uncharacterized protein LOC130046413 isoform X2 [Ostrea edulis]|uniref:uncharacterized protein LOC130046413 isoform X2 n=1 Tax=Ostrea edulis TaxID=37623 RepID=UPI0020951EE9|nr:uncharacterized protein LOC130046413 isoform X2 [Ostrea edulis]